MVIRRLSIIGVGLLGGSLGLAVKKCISDCHVVGYGHRALTLGKAIEMQAIDEGTQDLAVAVREADCVVLCTPVGTFEELLVRISPSLKPGAIVTDVGSTKRSVVESAHRILPNTVQFIGSHPMAGGEKRGVEFARGDLFQGAVCLTTPLPGNQPDAIETIENLWTTVGMRIIRLSPAEHDQRVALISHLPHAIATAVMAIQDDPSLALAGKGFLDLTRIAAGDGGLWRDIFLDNADSVRDGLTKLIQELDHFANLLRPESAAQLKDWLDQNARKRDSLS
jgi:prephenate dehydrogenase